jgi:hypothetical protein
MQSQMHLHQSHPKGQPHPAENIELERRNFRKKTDFTQWCNALNAGYFFNAPLNGI